MNPLTYLTLAISGVIFVLVADSLAVSAIAWVLCAVVALFFSTPRRPFLAANLLGLPAFVGFGLMYAPFGQEPGWWIITRDGLQIALSLGSRFLAATTIGLTIGSFVNLDQLMRTVQPRLPAKLVYVIGATARLLPLARARWQTIQQVRASRGVDVTTVRAKCRMVLPLIVGMVDDAATRARPLQRTGIGEPGPRTVLRPVPDTAVDWAVRLLAFAALVVGCWWAVN